MNKYTLIKNLFESNFDFESIEHDMEENLSFEKLYNYMRTRFLNDMPYYHIDVTMYTLLHKIDNIKIDEKSYRDLFGYLKMTLVDLLKKIEKLDIVMNNIDFVNENYVSIKKKLDYDIIVDCIETIIQLRKYLPLHSVLYFSFTTLDNKIVLFDQGQLNLHHYGYSYESEKLWHDRHYIMSEYEFDKLKEGYAYTFQKGKGIK